MQVMEVPDMPEAADLALRADLLVVLRQQQARVASGAQARTLLNPPLISAFNYVWHHDLLSYCSYAEANRHVSCHIRAMI